MSADTQRVPKRIHGLPVSPELRSRLESLLQTAEQPRLPARPYRPRHPRRPMPSSTWEMDAMLRLGYKSLREMWLDQFPPGSPEGLKRELAKQFGVSIETIRRSIREAGVSPYERMPMDPKPLPAEAATPLETPERPAERSAEPPPQDAAQQDEEAEAGVRRARARARTPEETLAIIYECVPRSAWNLADVSHMQRRASRLSDEELRSWLRRQFQR